MCSPWADLTSAPDGRVMCSVCLEWKVRAELAEHPEGGLWDTCKPCFEVENVC